MSEKKRKSFSSDFKAKVALEAIHGVKTLNEIGQEFDVHPVQVGKWKKEPQEQASGLFDAKRGAKPIESSENPEKLYTEIGRLKMELDWLKKIWILPMRTRRSWISEKHPLPVARQCALAGTNRSKFYVLPSMVVTNTNSPLFCLLDRVH